MTTRLITFLFVLFIACQPRETQKEPTTVPVVIIDKATYIKNLIDSIGFVQLPFKYDVYKSIAETSFSADQRTVDLLDFEYGPIQGVLPDTSRQYVFLHYIIGDSLYPVLTTFDKHGNKIDRQGIGVGNCNGGGPIARQDECTDVVTIHRDLTIEALYRFKGLVQPVDSLPAIYVCQQMVITGRITDNGRIELKEGEMENCLKKK